jgi:hypothetical protein
MANEKGTHKYLVDLTPEQARQFFQTMFPRTQLVLRTFIESGDTDILAGTLAERCGLSIIEVLGAFQEINQATAAAMRRKDQRL